MGRPGTLEEVARAFRADLLERDMAARREMVRAWEPVRRHLTAEVGRLTQAIRQRELEGRRVPVSWLFGRERLAQFERQVARELRDWRRRAEPEQKRAIRAAASIGPTHALELIRARAIPFPERAARQLVRFPAAEVERMVATLQAGSPLRELLEQANLTTAQELSETLIRGVATGAGPVVMGREMANALDGGLRRGLLIARTELLRTYRATTLEAYRANGNVVGGWRWWSSRDRRACLSCWAMHGTLHTLEEVLDDHPNGRCTMIPELRPETGLRSEPLESGPDQFARLPASDQLAILGPTRFDLYRAGEVRLEDFVHRPVHPRWGPMRRQGSISHARTRAAARAAGTGVPLPPGAGTREARLAELEAERDTFARALAAAEETQRAAHNALWAARLSGTFEEVMDAEAAVRRAGTRVDLARTPLRAAEDALEGYRNLPAVVAGRPSLEALGERLVVTGDWKGSDRVARYLDDLALVPEALMREVAAGGLTVRIDPARRIPSFPGHEDLAGVRPRGWREGSTWDDVGGLYDPSTRTIVVTAAGRDGSLSVILHEFGHALDHVRGLQDLPGVRAGHRVAFKTLERYFGGYLTQAGGAGRSETLAEGFAYLLAASPEVMDRRFTPGLARFLRRLMLGGDRPTEVEG